MEKLRIAVLASGRGSNFEAILKNINKGEIDATIAVVISNRKKAGALDIARNNNIPAVFVSGKEFPDQVEFNRQILNAIISNNANFIVLAGYMKMIGSEIISKFKNRILNIHPALLPSFGGKGMYGHFVHQAVLDYGCKISGATVHLVDEKYDNGAPVVQESVPVLEGDTADSLAARVLKVEHKIYSEAIKLFAEGRVEVLGRQIKIHSD